jgi:hypothetical protein
MKRKIRQRTCTPDFKDAKSHRHCGNSLALEESLGMDKKSSLSVYGG